MWRCLPRFLLLSCLLLPLHAPGQVPGEVGLRLQQLTVEQGLSQSTGRALAQDGDGSIWVGTQDGLNRYDGYGFRVFRHDPQVAGSLADNHVTVLASDHRGRLWVGTQAGGLGLYQPDTRSFHNYPVASGREDALAAVPVNAIAPASSGELWVASGRGHLQRLDRSGRRFTHLPIPADMQVRALLMLPGGELLVGSDRGLWLLASGRLLPWGRHPQLSGIRDVQALTRTASGRIWVGTAGSGAYELDASGGFLRRLGVADGLAGDDVRSLLADSRGRVWIATYTGLSRVDAEDAAPMQDQSDGLASERIHALMQDRDGLIWIGSWTAGVFLHQPGSEAFHEYREQPGDPHALPGNVVRTLLPDRDDTLWLGVQGGGLVHFDPKRGVLDRYHPGGDASRRLPSDRVQAIARDQDGSLWVGFVDVGLARRLPGAAEFESLAPDRGDPTRPRAGRVLTLYVDRAGTLWVGYEDGGLGALCRGCRRFRHYDHVPERKAGLPGQTISAVFEDRQGGLWVGARPGGLARLDRASGRFSPLADLVDAAPEVLPRTVTTVTQTRNGELWVGTQGGGLVRLTPTTGGRFRLKTYTYKEGLAGQAIGIIIEDAQGLLWLSTTLGISRLDPASGQIQNFGTRSGAQGEGYFIGAGGTLADGRIALGGLRGVTVFRPADIAASEIAHRPVITDIRAFQSSADGTTDWRYRGGDQGRDSLWLRAGSGGFGFAFSALAYADPDLVQYSYRLDPLDRDWTDADASQRNAGYPHLAPGDYTLRVRARFPGERYGLERVVDVHLDPLWWQSLWARIGFVVVLLVPFAFWGWNRRQRGVEREHAQAVLAESEERLQLALWGTGDEFWDADLRTGALVRVNPLAHLKLSHDMPALTFAILLDHVHEDDRAGMTEALRRHLNGESPDLDTAYRLRDNDGQWRWLRSRGRSVERDAHGTPLRMAGVTEDITELREHARMLERVNQALEERVGQRTSDLTRVNRELNATIDELRLTQHQLVETEKLAALGSLVAGIAHEVNTPLGVGVTAASHLEQQARSFLRGLESGAATPERVSAFGQEVGEASALVLRNLQRADRMIRSFKQVAVDQASEAPRLISVRDYLDEILLSLQPLLKRSPHQLTIEVVDGLSVTTQPGALYQIVANLVTNSLVHAFEGIARGNIRLGARPEGDGWVFDYADDGVGMSEEVRRHLFDPFFTTRRGRGGSGLGMHIVYNLAVQALGGTIECHSEPGKGTRFVLHVPRR